MTKIVKLAELLSCSVRVFASQTKPSSFGRETRCRSAQVSTQNVFFTNSLLNFYPVTKIVSVLILIFAAQNLCAQLDPNRLIPSQVKINAPIFDAMPDRMGNIWLATQAGLMCYDGYDLRRYYSDPNDSSTIGAALTYKLFEDSDGTIWIGSMGSVSAYNPRYHSFKNYSISHLTDFPDYSQPAPIQITPDNCGRIYFGINSFIGMTNSHALIYFDKKEQQLKRFEYSKGDSINNIDGLTTDQNNNVWISSQSGIFKIDSLHNLTPVRDPFKGPRGANNRVSALQCLPSGKILMAANKFILYAYDPVRDVYSSWKIPGISEKTKDDFYVFDMLNDSLGNTWIGSNHGLFCFNRVKGSFQTFRNNPFTKENIYALRFDSFGNLWISTNSMGLMRYSNRPLLKSFVYNPDNPQSVTNGWAGKIFPSSDGSFWIATDGDILTAGLNLLNPATNTLKPYPYHTFLPEMEYYNTLEMIRPEEFLIRTNKGFFECNPVTWKCTSTELEGIPQQTYIRQIKEDSHHNTIYCTVSGLYLKSPDGKIRHYNHADFPVSSDSITELTDVYESPKHGLWLLTNNGLFLYHYDTDKVERVGYSAGKGNELLSQDINSFYEDSAGIAWIGTWQGGLSRYNPETGKIKTYTINDGLPFMAIQGILGDKKNKALWLSTFNGISRFNIQDETFNNFSVEDGIQGALFADGAYASTKQGSFAFGGNNGITYFESDDVSKKSVPPKVFITDFKVADKSYRSYLDTPYKTKRNGESKLTLSYDQNNLSIEYTGIQYDNPAKNQFAYQLENYDEGWRDVKNNKTAYYYNLPPGNYTFRVKAANSTGIWNKKGASISFSITPPWWKTWWAYCAYGFLFVGGIFAFDRMQRKRVLEKERRLASEKELEQAREIEKAYKELKTTQTQLIQSEKMASLGELTAGIAHEIQNPLNFVNNFSEVSNELIDEMNEELDKGEIQEAKAIASDIKQNLEKINHHGKRADSIVKGMLQHSRTSSGQKEPTDINALADEYLRLAYHGLRAKDKSFNAIMKTDFDESIGKINVVPQDIGRVILNLITNAFYVVDEKNKILKDGYEPTISVSTKKIGNQVSISVKDNGNGIPSAIKDKIFQPFFTTKPTGQGTGLGLSLSYDIIKAHGGEIKVESLPAEAATLAGKENPGTEFTILLPIN